MFKFKSSSVLVKLSVRMNVTPKNPTKEECERRKYEAMKMKGLI
jgi:hypothetical protein